MSTVTLNPDAYIGTDPGATPSGTAVTALSDSNDSTYVTRSTSNSDMVFNLSTTSKPAGSVLKSVQTGIRVQPTSGSCYAEWWALIFGGTPTPITSQVFSSITTATGPVYTGWGDRSQAEIDVFQLRMRAKSPTTSSPRFVKGYLTLTFAEIPTTAVATPTGTVTVSDVPGTWTHTPGTDGGNQSHYEVKVFSAEQYNGTGFNPDTSSPTWTSGIVSGASTGTTAPSLTGGVYRWYTRTAQLVNGTPHWASWDFEAFTVSLSTAEVDTVTPAAVSASGKINVVVARLTSADAWDHVEVERNVGTDSISTIGALSTGTTTATGWTGTSFGTPTSASRAITGGFQRLTATIDNGDAYGIGASSPLDRIAVDPGQMVEFSVDAKGSLTGSNVSVLLLLWWYDRNGTILLDTREAFTTPLTSSTIWRRITMNREVPANSASVYAQIELNGGVGASAAAAVLDLRQARLIVDGEWVAVPFAATTLVSTNTVTIADHEAPPDVSVRYRARAIKSDATTGRWVEQTSTTEWDADGVWIKNPDDDRDNLKLDWVEFPDPTEDIVQGVFYPLGSTHAVVVSEERQSRTGEWLFETETDAQIVSLKHLMKQRHVLVQAPGSYKWASGYFAPGTLQEVAPSDSNIATWRYWRVGFVEVDRP